MPRSFLNRFTQVRFAVAMETEGEVLGLIGLRHIPMRMLTVRMREHRFNDLFLNSMSLYGEY